MTIERITLRTSFVAAFAFVAALASTPAHAQDRPDFDRLAKHTAEAIDKIATGSPDDTAVFVSVFDELRVPESELGIELSKEFEAALRSHARNFRVISADDLERMAASHGLPEAIPSYPPAIKCSARDLGLGVLVEGSITYGPAGAVIEVLAVQPSPRHSILLESELFPINDSLR